MKELKKEIILISRYDNVETHGISTLRKVPEIKSTDGQVMATGEVIEERKLDILLKSTLKIKRFNC